MKTCTKCKIEKDIKEFAKDRSKPSGLRPSCKLCKSKQDKIYRNKNKQKIAENKAIYAKNNHIRISQYKRNWELLNRDRLRHRIRNACHKRRVLLQNSTLTAAAYDNWVTQQEKICTYCAIRCTKTFHVDHIIPLSKGGEHALDNLTIACKKCNQSKSNNTLITWLAKKKLIEARDKKPKR